MNRPPRRSTARDVIDAHLALWSINTMSTKANTNRKIRVELESHELDAVRRIRYLDDIMTGVLDSARPSRVDGFVILTGDRFALEHLAGELAHAVNHSRRWSAQVDALSGAVDAIESALANH